MAISLASIAARAGTYPSKVADFGRSISKFAESVKAYVDAELLTNREVGGTLHLAAAAADTALATGDGYNEVFVNDEITVTMPPAVSGRRIKFTQIGTAVLTVAQNADDANIAGADTDYVALDAAGDTATFYCDGTEWLLVESSIA